MTRRRPVTAAAASRRLTAALCLALGLGLIAGLQRWTLGFEVWTFESRRQAQLQAGALRAAGVALRGSDGHALRLAQGGAAPAALLVDFVYTRCPSVCRALGSEYQQMQQALAVQGHAAPGVQLVSVSFDLAHDDPATLARHAAGLRADPRRWRFAVPAGAADLHALLRSLGVVVIADGQGGFVHNGAIHLLDAHGRLRGLYEADQWHAALAAAQRLAGTPQAP